MILIVKGKSYKNLIRKVIAMTLLVTMFSFYYIHMSNKFQEEKIKLENELLLKMKL